MVSETTALQQAGVATGGVLDDAIDGRAAVFEMTQAAEDAVLRPQDTGPWSHELRAALAARIAAVNGETDLAARYGQRAGTFADLADPANTGAAQGLTEVVGFMDKVAADTRNVAAADISGLQTAGVADADIVRLAELNAFLAYQIRVIAGLRLMQGAFA